MSYGPLAEADVAMLKSVQAPTAVEAHVKTGVKRRSWFRLALAGMAVAAVLATALGNAFAKPPSGPAGASPLSREEGVDSAALMALSARLAAETDRMTVGLAQISLNTQKVPTGDPARR